MFNFRNFSVGAKLILLVTSNLVLLAVILVGFSVYKISAGLEFAYLNQLTAVKTAKSDELKSLENNLSSLLVSLAASYSTKEAFSELSEGFNNLSSDAGVGADEAKKCFGFLLQQLLYQ